MILHKERKPHTKISNSSLKFFDWKHCYKNIKNKNLFVKVKMFYCRNVVVNFSAVFQQNYFRNTKVQDMDQFRATHKRQTVLTLYQLLSRGSPSRDYRFCHHLISNLQNFFPKNLLGKTDLQKLVLWKIFEFIKTSSIILTKLVSFTFGKNILIKKIFLNLTNILVVFQKFPQCVWIKHVTKVYTHCRNLQLII